MKRLLPFLTLAAAFACSDPVTRGRAAPCSTDEDCPGASLCVDNYCQQNCVIDNDCPDNQVCEGTICAEGRSPDAIAGSIGKCIPTELYPGYRSCIMDLPQHIEPRGSELQQELENIPASVNLRNDFIDANCPPVHSQGQCGWCVAHAVTAAMETLECKVQSAERISEPHLWFAGMGSVDDCYGGWYISSAMRTAINTKLVPGSVWNYIDDPDILTATQPSALVLQQQGKYDLDSFYTIYKKSSSAIEKTLARGLSVVYSFPIFCDVGWIYTNTAGEDDAHLKNIIAPPANPGPCTRGTDFQGCPEAGKPYCLTGYHVVLMVGYDQSSQQFLFRNSWGDGWADNGYSLISYEYVERFGEGGFAAKKCIPQVVAACDNGDVYWRDSCGQKGELKQDCTEYERCENAQCVSNCTTNAATVCENGNVVSKDSCGRLEAVIQQCSDGCENSSCRTVGPSCTSHTRLECGAGGVYWQNSCGNLEEMVEYCSEGCRSGQCITPPPGCTPNPRRVCYGNDVYIDDMCGSSSYLASCGSAQICSGGQCVSNCTPDDSRRCSNGDVYSYDSCGSRGSKVQDCTSSQHCTNGQCVTECTPNASLICYNGDAYHEDSCGTRGSRADDCSSTETCQDGACVVTRCTNTSETWVDGALCWQKQPTTTELMYPAQARDYCPGLTYAGFSDWRTPTIRELRTIVRGCPAIETGGPCPIYSGSDVDYGSDCTRGCPEGAGPGVNGCYMTTSIDGPCSHLWSSSWGGGGPFEAGAFSVYYSNGILGYGLTTYSNATVRCVRDNR